MTELHPITPSPELIEEWIELSRPTPVSYSNPNVLATYAARWGYEQHEKMLLDAMHATVPLHVAEDDIDLFQDQ